MREKNEKSLVVNKVKKIDGGSITNKVHFKASRNEHFPF